MDLEESKNMWTNYGKKLDANLHINREAIKKMNLDKTRSELRILLLHRFAESALALIMVVTLFGYIGIHITEPQFAIPAVILDVFAMVGLAGSIGQILLIGRIDYSDPVSIIQTNIETIKSHLLQNTKLLILSIPFYIAYILLGFQIFFDVDLVAEGDPMWWTANIIFSLVMLVPCIWLYRKLSSNDNLFIRSFVRNIGGNRLLSSVDYLNEIEKFEKEN